MREIVSYYPVRDVHTIRVVCHHTDCRAATELPVDNVADVMKKTGGCCPVCGKPFTKPDVEGGADVITMLAKVALALNELAPLVGIELPMRQED